MYVYLSVNISVYVNYVYVEYFYVYVYLPKFSGSDATKKLMTTLVRRRGIERRVKWKYVLYDIGIKKRIQEYDIRDTAPDLKKIMISFDKLVEDDNRPQIVGFWRYKHEYWIVTNIWSSSKRINLEEIYTKTHEKMFAPSDF